MKNDWERIVLNLPERGISINLEVANDLVMIDTNGFVSAPMLEVFTTIIEKMRNEYYHFYDDPFDWFIDKADLGQIDCCRKEREVFFSMNDLLNLLRYANDF